MRLGNVKYALAATFVVLALVAIVIYQRYSQNANEQVVETQPVSPVVSAATTTEKGESNGHVNERSERPSNTGEASGEARSADPSVRPDDRGDRPGEPERESAPVSGGAWAGDDRAESRVPVWESSQVQALSRKEAANRETLRVAEAEASRLNARTRPIRRPPEIVRVDARRCKVVADEDAITYTQAAIVRPISAMFLCPACWCECRVQDCDGSRQIVVEFADGGRQTVSEVWP